MPSHSNKHKMQSLTIKPLLSQLPGRTCSVFYILNTSLRCIRRVLSRLQSIQDSSLKTQRRRRRSLQTVW